MFFITKGGYYDKEVQMKWLLIAILVIRTFIPINEWNKMSYNEKYMAYFKGAVILKQKNPSCKDVEFKDFEAKGMFIIEVRCIEEENDHQTSQHT